MAEQMKNQEQDLSEQRKVRREKLAELQKARVHAETMTRLGKESKYRFTNPLFDLLEEEKPISDGPQTDVDDFIDVCKKRKCFDLLRDREDFKALLTK